MGRNKIIFDLGTRADIELLRNSHEFRALSTQQRVFVQVLLTTGDAKAATIQAYPKVSSDASRRSLQWQVLRAEAAQNFIEVWKWRDTPSARAQLIQICRTQLAACETGSVASQRYAAELARITLGLKPGRRALEDEDPDEPGEPQPPETGAVALAFTVGMRVTERDAAGIVHVGIVQELDVNGKPSKVEEIL